MTMIINIHYRFNDDKDDNSGDDDDDDDDDVNVQVGHSKVFVRLSQVRELDESNSRLTALVITAQAGRSPPPPPSFLVPPGP